MKTFTNVKAARAFACFLIVSVLTTTIASPLHLVFANTAPQKESIGNFFTGFGRTKTNSPFDKKYQNSVLKLMRDFIFDPLVLPKLTAAGCTFKNVAEYVTNPKCFPESTADAEKKLTLATIQSNLLHEVYAGTSGKCGAHRDGRKGAYTIEQCIGYPWGVEKCTVISEAISTIGGVGTHCAKKSVPISTSNKVPYNSAPNKATRDQVKAYLTKVLNSNQIYKGSCKATTLAQLTTLPDCNTSALMNPDNYKPMKEVWRTLYTSAYDASSGDYGVSSVNTVGRKGTLFELGIVPNYNGDAHKLVDGTKFFGVTLPKTTAAQNSKLTVGLTNTVLICLAGGFAILACFAKLPDEYARGFLQLFINKDVIPQNWKTLYGNLSIDKLGVDIGEVGVDLLTNTLLVYGLQKGTNQVIKLINAMTMKKSPEALADLLIDAKTTVKIMIVGPLIVVALTACKALQKCDQPFQFQNSELIDDTTKGGIIAFFVATVFCLKDKKIDPTCVKNTISVILFEFTRV